ncbi:hypothetical protein HZ326_5672 [Fusarium oxysporum f. sp. albedinis]|nr:hypothetical protein HZ326_5672 [Fusarium oxysporum f. sp. albedinis]
MLLLAGPEAVPQPLDWLEWPRVSPLINSNRPRRVSISHHQRNTLHPTRGRVGSREKLFVLRVVSDPLQAHDLVVAPAELDPDSANSAASAPPLTLSALPFHPGLFQFLVLFISTSTSPPWVVFCLRLAPHPSLVAQAVPEREKKKTQTK